VRAASATRLRPHAVASVIAEPSVRGRHDRQLDADTDVLRKRVPGGRRSYDVDLHAVDANECAAERLLAGVRTRVERVPRG